MCELPMKKQHRGGNEENISLENIVVNTRPDGEMKA